MKPVLTLIFTQNINPVIVIHMYSTFMSINDHHFQLTLINLD